MKQVFIAGRLGRDAETRQVGDTTVTGFSVAVDGRDGKEKVTLWFDVSIWGRRGEALAQYLTKGAAVSVSGDLGRREHEGKVYLTVRADQITLQGSRSEGGQARQDAAPIDDEVPF